MRWVKEGPIYATPGDKWWNKTHTQYPVVELDCNGLVRIYFGSRDSEGRSRIGYVCVDYHNFRDIIKVSEKPLIELGRRGWFDSDGMTPSCLVKWKGKKYLYYNGWKAGLERCGIGVLVSDDSGQTWHREFNGPVFDCNPYDPITVATPYVLTPDDTGYDWRMYYTSYIKWDPVGGIVEPFYNVKLATSPDGINWAPAGITALDLEGTEGGIGRVAVINENGYFKMWFPVRNRTNYRKNATDGFRIGYATSRAGVKFLRGSPGIMDLSPSTGNRIADAWKFDCEMTTYPAIFKFADQTYMFYNGNDFGRGGIGYAIREDY